MTPTELREIVFERDQGRCRWPGCEDPATVLAHITHRGMGGSKYRNTEDNAFAACEIHHDVLDGRTALGTLRWELNQLMRYVIARDIH